MTTELEDPTALQSIVEEPEEAEAMMNDLEGLEEDAEEDDDLKGWELKMNFEVKDLKPMKDELQELANAGT